MAIGAVIFDMGGTIETFGYTRELRLEATTQIQEYLLQAGINLHLSNEELYEVISGGLEQYKRWSIHTMTELPPARVWSDYVFVGQALEESRLAEIAEDLMFFIETRYYHREMRPEIPAVLEAIKKMGLKIGLISNVNSRGQVPLNLKSYGIFDYFNPIVLSSEYGRRKPDPAIFHYTARLAELPTSKCLYVGDRIARDILGARKAGFRLAVKIHHNFDHGEIDEGATPDVTIKQMTELLNIIEVENNQTIVPEPHEHIKAILFDAGDILYHRPEKYKEFGEFLQSLKLSPEYDRVMVEKESLAHKAYRGQISQDHYREAIVRLCGVTQPDLVERGKKILDDEDNNISFFDGIPETLKKLKEQGYLLGVITDTASPLHVKLNWFERGGFGDVWDSIISSKELGARKPESQLYLAALHQLGLTAQQAIFVGHKAIELDGARSVGLKTVAFNHDEDAYADFTIKNFPDLIDILHII
jgi:putative hydrolase of the HAD superfamily